MTEASAQAEAPSQRIPWWLWFNVLSLDAPLLAVLWQWAFALAYRVKLWPACYWVLGLAVWGVYVADRTLDGFRERQDGRLSARHQFYRRYRWLFALLVLPMLGAGLMVIALTQIPSGLMMRGLVLAFVVCLYLLHYAARGNRFIFVGGNVAVCAAGLAFVWLVPLPPAYRLAALITLAALVFVSAVRLYYPGLRLLPKELLCGFLFAAGCSLGVNFFTHDAPSNPLLAVETVLLGVLCALNCIAIACYEQDHDARNDPDAITQTWPEIGKAYPVLLATLASFAVMALNLHLTREVIWFVASILVSTVLLGVLHIVARRLPPELPHVLADLALVTPIFWLVQG